MTKRILRNYEKAIQDLADCFVEKYFDKDADCWWVGDRVGDVFFVNNYWFDVERMREALEFGATADQLFEFQNHELEMFQRNEKANCNFISYLRGFDICLKQ